jgi:hypothetical protein
MNKEEFRNKALVLQQTYMEDRDIAENAFKLGEAIAYVRYEKAARDAKEIYNEEILKLKVRAREEEMVAYEKWLDALVDLDYEAFVFRSE